MISVKNEKFVKYEDGVSAVIMRINVDSAQELPETDDFSGKILYQGSTARDLSTGDFYALTSSGEWVRQKNSSGGSATEVYNAGKTVPQGSSVTVDGQTYTVGVNAEIFNSYENNHAVGNYSHAEGINTLASGAFSHAEGDHSYAISTYSHAEGNGTLASGICSHAEGHATTARGNYSHAEGNFSTASGIYSHSEGYSTASADFAHSEGSGAVAASIAQHAQGKFNAIDSNNKYAFIIGNGTDNDNRSNALAIDWDGKIYVNGSSTGIDLNNLLSRIQALENN